jgi:hypothetical protein
MIDDLDNEGSRPGHPYGAPDPRQFAAMAVDRHAESQISVRRVPVISHRHRMKYGGRVSRKRSRVDDLSVRTMICLALAIFCSR